jgi:glucosyl-3-phosphoglycerate synthase
VAVRRYAVQDHVREWFSRRTYNGWEWTPRELLRRKNKGAGTRISVVLPALDEEATVGTIVSTIVTELCKRVPLVDEVIVMDSGSTDHTAVRAAAAGAKVVAADAVLPWMGPARGKGEALWKSLFVASGDILVFVDADLRQFTPQFVTGLLGPLLVDPEIVYVKGAYDRPAPATGNAANPAVKPVGGGRVTELLARPVINAYWPDLSGFIQPLSGEYAGRRSALAHVPFATGYGVEIGLLVDLLERCGLDSLAQVDLGRRVHHNQADEALGRMASEVLHTAQRRLGPTPLPYDVLAQFRRGRRGKYEIESWRVPTLERPPAASVIATVAYVPDPADPAVATSHDDGTDDMLTL